MHMNQTYIHQWLLYNPSIAQSCIIFNINIPINSFLNKLMVILHSSSHCCTYMAVTMRAFQLSFIYDWFPDRGKSTKYFLFQFQFSAYPDIMWKIDVSS